MDENGSCCTNEEGYAGDVARDFFGFVEFFGTNHVANDDVGTACDAKQEQGRDGPDIVDNGIGCDIVFRDSAGDHGSGRDVEIGCYFRDDTGGTNAYVVLADFLGKAKR